MAPDPSLPHRTLPHRQGLGRASLIRWLAPVLGALLGAGALALSPMPAKAAGTLTLLQSRALDAGAAPGPLPWPPGTRWQLDAAGLRGPMPLQCRRARQQLVRLPPQGLFQGAWQNDADAQAIAKAQALGLSGTQTTTLRLDCANASFDLHRATPDHLLTAIDGQVLVLQHLPDRTDAHTPVRELLLQHLAEQGAFDTERLARLRAWLAPSLRRAFEAWFARPANPAVAPYLDGDPFTDSQEPPAALTLGELKHGGTQAWQAVFVEFDGSIRRPIVYRLQRQPQGDWRISDIEYGHDTTLLQLLRKDTAPARR